MSREISNGIPSSVSITAFKYVVSKLEFGTKFGSFPFPNPNEIREIGNLKPRLEEYAAQYESLHGKKLVVRYQMDGAGPQSIELLQSFSMPSLMREDGC